MFEGKFQIGKQGLTDGVINSINSMFKTHTQLRISILKSATRNREELKKIAEDLTQKVSFPCRSRIIGYTIILKKQANRPKKTKG